MDYLTSCYRSKIRLFRDRPDILVAGRWYWCPPDAVAVPYLHRFGSMHYDYEDFELPPDQLGEVETLPGYASGVANRRYTGQRWCGGEEVWTEGALFAQQGAPPADPDGVPLCCLETPRRGGDRVEGEAGFTVLTDCMVLWLRPEELSGLADGAPVPTWPGAQPNVVRDGVAPAGLAPFISRGGSPDPQVVFESLDRTLTLQPSLTLAPGYAVYAVAIMPTSAVASGYLALGLTGAQWAARVQPGPQRVSWQDSLTGRSAAAPVMGVPLLLTVFRGETDVRFRLGELLSPSQAAAAAGTLSLDSVGLTTPGFAPGVGLGLAELVVLDCTPSDAHDVALLYYLAMKYGFELTMLFLEAFDALFLDAGDPLYLG